MEISWRDFKNQVPSSLRYEHALRSMQSELLRSKNALAMLEAHHNAPFRTLTAREMAERVGYNSHGAANLQYGKLGAALGHALGLSLTFKVNSIADFILPGEAGNKELQWVMWPQLAKALDRTLLSGDR